MDENIKLTLYRVFQEQISNIIKYAKAKLVTITLKVVEEQQVILSISDNGTGFDQQEKKKGIGLSNIQSRVAMHKGNVGIHSKKGSGCELKITIPFIKQLSKQDF